MGRPGPSGSPCGPSPSPGTLKSSPLSRETCAAVLCLCRTRATCGKVDGAGGRRPVDLAAGGLQELQSSSARRESPRRCSAARPCAWIWRAAPAGILDWSCGGCYGGTGGGILSLSFPLPVLPLPLPLFLPALQAEGAILPAPAPCLSARADSLARQRARRLPRPPSRCPDAQHARRSPSPLKRTPYARMAKRRRRPRIFSAWTPRRRLKNLGIYSS